MLVEKIRDIEAKFADFVATADACGRERTDRLTTTGWSRIDAMLGGGLPDSGLHEWFGVAAASSAPTSQAPGGGSRRDAVRGRWMPPVCIVVHLAWRAMDRCVTPRWAVWIGRRTFPYPRAMVRGDMRLLDRSIFVAPRDRDARLWAADLALRSPATALVIADGSEFNMAATRRLHLAARREHKWLLLIRPPWECGELSAAHSRWLVRWPGMESVSADESSSSCRRINPRWIVELLRCKGVQPERERPTWMLEWHRGKGVVDLSAPLAGAAGEAAHVEATTDRTDGSSFAGREGGRRSA